MSSACLLTLLRCLIVLASRFVSCMTCFATATRKRALWPMRCDSTSVAPTRVLVSHASSFSVMLYLLGSFLYLVFSCLYFSSLVYRLVLAALPVSLIKCFEPHRNNRTYVLLSPLLLYVTLGVIPAAPCISLCFFHRHLSNVAQIIHYHHKLLRSLEV